MSALLKKNSPVLTLISQLEASVLVHTSIAATHMMPIPIVPYLPMRTRSRIPSVL
jgi:hypothetical protein